MSETIHTPYAEGYGQITVTRGASTVETTPDRAMLTVALLRELPGPVSDSGIYLGEDDNGNPVHYRITGWDTEHKALIVERDW